MMKTYILTALIIAFLSVFSAQASNKGEIIYTNIEKTENGTIKEYILYNTITSQAIKKTTYSYDSDNNILSKIEYDWSSLYGWVNNQKHEYEYNDGLIIYVTHTRWDEKKNKWATRSEQMAYNYNTDGDFISTQKTNINNELITLR
nr:DUF3836 domain-containing protein [Dysgonomonas sp. BGC7]